MCVFLSLLALYISLSLSYMIPKPAVQEAVNKTLSSRAHISADCGSDRSQIIAYALMGVAVLTQYTSRIAAFPQDAYDRNAFYDRFGGSLIDTQGTHEKRMAVVRNYLSMFQEADRSPSGRTAISCIDVSDFCRDVPTLRAYTDPQRNIVHLVVIPSHTFSPLVHFLFRISL